MVCSCSAVYEIELSDLDVEIVVEENENSRKGVSEVVSSSCSGEVAVRRPLKLTFQQTRLLRLLYRCEGLLSRLTGWPGLVSFLVGSACVFWLGFVDGLAANLLKGSGGVLWLGFVVRFARLFNRPVALLNRLSGEVVVGVTGVRGGTGFACTVKLLGIMLELW